MIMSLFRELVAGEN